MESTENLHPSNSNGCGGQRASDNRSRERDLSQVRTIAIDGPAGSGKSTVGRMLAQRFGYRFLDTGILYRAVTWAALERRIEPSDGEKLAKLARDSKIGIYNECHGESLRTRIEIDGRDVTSEIRLPEVDSSVSAVSSHPEVRAALLDRQREIAHSGPSVLVGRDIGTVVLPDADLKLYIDATPEERAQRRHRELTAKGVDASYTRVLEDLRYRDGLDANKSIYSLRKADDAVALDTTGKTPDEVVSEIEELMSGCK